LHLDTTVHLFKSMLNFIPRAIPKLDFVMITGDLIPHNVWETNMKTTFKEIEEVAGILKENLPENVPIFRMCIFQSNINL
jgi:hypothetical protein